MPTHAGVLQWGWELRARMDSPGPLMLLSSPNGDVTSPPSGPAEGPPVLFVHMAALRRVAGGRTGPVWQQRAASGAVLQSYGCDRAYRRAFAPLRTDTRHQ